MQTHSLADMPRNSEESCFKCSAERNKKVTKDVSKTAKEVSEDPTAVASASPAVGGKMVGLLTATLSSAQL